MKYKILFPGILMLLATNCFSQETKKYFTIYSNGYLEAFDKPLNMNKGYQAIFPFPSFAYQKESKRFFYQIDLMPFLFDAKDDMEIVNYDEQVKYLTGSEQRIFESSLGFILKYWVLEKEKVRINIAIENRLYFLRKFYSPYDAAIYAHSENNYGLSTSLGFEIETPINDQFSLTFMPLYRINEYYLKQAWSGNPQIPEKFKTVFFFSDTFNPLKFNFKLGLKIKI